MINIQDVSDIEFIKDCEFLNNQVKNLSSIVLLKDSG